jgi:hypothetical protein
VALVERVIVRGGYVPIEVRSDGADGETMTWRLRAGDTPLFVIVRSVDEGVDQQAYVQVLAPILELPASEREQLYERLLVLNTEALAACAFALDGERVVITKDRSARDMNRSELEEIVDCVLTFAEEYGDALAQEFGAGRAE